MVRCFQCPDVDCGKVYAHKQSFRKHWAKKHGPNIPPATIVERPPKQRRRRNLTNRLVGDSQPPNEMDQRSQAMIEQLEQHPQARIEQQSPEMVNHTQHERMNQPPSEMDQRSQAMIEQLEQHPQTRIEQQSPEMMNHTQHERMNQPPSEMEQPSQAMIEQLEQHPRAMIEQSNPHTDLPVMQNIMLGDEETWKKRLEGVVMTPEGLYDAYGVIGKINGVNRTCARKIWKRITKGLNQTSHFENYQFLNCLGRKKASIPVLTLAQILGLMPHLPGRVGQQMNQAAVNLGLRTAAGDSDVRVASMIQEQRLSAEMQNKMMVGLASSKSAIEHRSGNQQVENNVLRSLEIKLRQQELEYTLNNYTALKDLEIRQKEVALCERESDIRKKRKQFELERDKFVFEKEHKSQKLEFEKEHKSQQLELEKKERSQQLELEKKEQSQQLELEKKERNQKLELEVRERELKMKLAGGKQELDKQRLQNEREKIESARKKQGFKELKEAAELLKQNGNWSGIDAVSYTCQVKDMFKLSTNSTIMSIMKLIYKHLGEQTPLRKVRILAKQIQKYHILHHKNAETPEEEMKKLLEDTITLTCAGVVKTWQHQKKVT